MTKECKETGGPTRVPLEHRHCSFLPAKLKLETKEICFKPFYSLQIVKSPMYKRR